MYKNAIYVFVVLSLIGVIFLISIGQKDDKDSYNIVNEKEVIQLLKEDAVLVDVRTEDEYNSKHIKGALNIPLDKISDIELEKNKKIIVYCQSGKRSKQAANTLVELGFSEVYDFGSINNWMGEFN